MSKAEIAQLVDNRVIFTALATFLASGVFTYILTFKLISQICELEDRVFNLESKFMVVEATIDQPQDETV